MVMASFEKGNPPWGADDELRADLSPPGPLLPVQYYSAPAASPYQRLLIAILEDAICCFQRNFAVRKGPRRILFQETQEWLFDSVGSAFLSCPMVCESLGINSVRLRRYLRQWQLRMKAGHARPRLTRRRLVPDNPRITSPDVYRTQVTSAESSSMSRGTDVPRSLGPETSSSDALQTRGDSLRGPHHRTSIMSAERPGGAGYLASFWMAVGRPR
jgi:hypothetical protein